jgi:hypothetical protein
LEKVIIGKNIKAIGSNAFVPLNPDHPEYATIKVIEINIAETTQLGSRADWGLNDSVTISWIG